MALRCNVHIWKSPLNKYIDNTLERKGVKLINLSWNSLKTFKKDPDHFTLKGFKKFCYSLKQALKLHLPENKKLHIIADSTIDYWNYDKEKYTGYGNKYLKSIFLYNHVTIDAMSGSGYHSYKSFSNRTISNKPDILLFIGGWNDYSFVETHKKIKKIFHNNNNVTRIKRYVR